MLLFMCICAAQQHCSEQDSPWCLSARCLSCRRKIAYFYIYHSTFFVDLISTCVFLAEFISYSVGVVGSKKATVVQTVQILRAIRYLSYL